MIIIFLGFVCLLLVIGFFTGRPFKFAFGSLVLMGALLFVYVAITLVTMQSEQKARNEKLNTTLEPPRPDGTDGFVRSLQLSGYKF